MATTRKRGEGGAKRAAGETRRAAGGPRKPRQTAKQKRRQESARGALEARAMRLEALPPEARALADAIDADGGMVLGALRDPLAGHPLLLAALPIERIEPTAWQRSASPTHVEHLADAITKTGAYLDPVIAFRDPSLADGGTPWHTPNGGHRLAAMRKMGARAITALVVPDTSIAWRILALNTEKAHNLRERALEVSRMAHALAPLGGRESEYAPYFEEAALLTVGLAYEKQGRLAGAAWYPIVKRLETFSDAPLSEILALRESHADELLELDARVSALVNALRAQGLQSPYLRNFVVARINPLRFVPRGKAQGRALDWDETFEKMRRAAGKFDVGKVQPTDLAHAGGPVEEAD